MTSAETRDNTPAQRLGFLARVVARESAHLRRTDQLLFAEPFTVERARKLASDEALAERVDAFVSRFARLQDTLGDKLLPALLRFLGESPSLFIDNLDRAERLGWIPSSDQWLAARQLRNQMIHDYVEDPAVLANALQSGHTLVDMLLTTAKNLVEELHRRGIVEAPA